MYLCADIAGITAKEGMRKTIQWSKILPQVLLG